MRAISNACRLSGIGMSATLVPGFHCSPARSAARPLVNQRAHHLLDKIGIAVRLAKDQLVQVLRQIAILSNAETSASVSSAPSGWRTVSS